VHVATHCPLSQVGVGAEQSPFVVHCGPPVGTHAPFTQLVPCGHAPPSLAHVATHSPLSQTSPCGHWLVYWHAFADAVHAPPAHTKPLPQSLLELHGQGPLVPPQRMQVWFQHSSPLGQSLFELQPWFASTPVSGEVPASLFVAPSWPVLASPGEPASYGLTVVHCPWRHWNPVGQSLDTAHACPFGLTLLHP
jgi:hypothetical protein